MATPAEGASISNLIVVAGPPAVGVHAGASEATSAFVHSGSTLGAVVANIDVTFVVDSGPDAGAHGVCHDGFVWRGIWRYQLTWPAPMG